MTPQTQPYTTVQPRPEQSTAGFCVVALASIVAVAGYAAGGSADLGEPGTGHPCIGANNPIVVERTDSPLRYYGYYASAWYLDESHPLHMAFPEVADHVNLVDVHGKLPEALKALKQHNDDNADRVAAMVHTHGAVIANGRLRTRQEALAWWANALPTLREYEALITGFYLADEPYMQTEDTNSHAEVWEALSFVAETIKRDFPNEKVWLNYTPRNFGRESAFPSGVDWVSVTPDYGDRNQEKLNSTYCAVRKKVLSHNRGVGRNAIQIVQFGDAFTYAGKKRIASSTIRKQEIVFGWINEENADGDLADVVAYYPFIWRDFPQGYGLSSAPSAMQAAFRSLSKEIIGEKFQFDGYLERPQQVGDQLTISGWACLAGHRTQVDVHVYVGGPYGTGKPLGSGHATRPSESAVSARCRSGLAAHRFLISVPMADLDTYGGQALYVYGVASGIQYAGSTLLTGSGSHAIGRPPVGDTVLSASGVVTGWACDLDRPEDAIAVHIYAGTNYVMGGYANLAGEAAIGTQCGGSTNRRFRFQLPAWTKLVPIKVYGINVPSGTNPLLKKGSWLYWGTWESIGCIPGVGFCF